MNIAILPNINKKDAVSITCNIILKLVSLRAQVHLSSDFKDKFAHLQVNFAHPDKLLEGCDLAVAVGGDGTIIYALKLAALNGKPVLGVNAGRLGFMAGVEQFELDKLDALMSGNYSVEKKLMLEVTIEKEDGSETAYHVLNDAVISKGTLSKIIDLPIYHNNEKILEYRADGVIVATPTGSTAYSFSAGGPVIDPKIFCFLLTPICPHSLFSRTIIFDGHSSIEIRPKGKKKNEIFLTIDGEKSVPVNFNDKIRVCVANLSANLIRIKDKAFFHIINEKFIDRRL